MNLITGLHHAHTSKSMNTKVLWENVRECPNSGVHMFVRGTDSRSFKWAKTQSCLSHEWVSLSSMVSLKMFVWISQGHDSISIAMSCQHILCYSLCYGLQLLCSTESEQLPVWWVDYTKMQHWAQWIHFFHLLIIYPDTFGVICGAFEIFTPRSASTLQSP